MDFGNPNGNINMTNNGQTQTPGGGEQQQQQRSTTGNGIGGFNNIPVVNGNNLSTPAPTLDGEISTHQVPHTGVVCDNCDKPICGFRYKCMQCRDYDLCSICERRGLHAGHVMMRIAFPEMTSDALRRFLPQVEQPGLPRRPFSCGGMPTSPPGHPHGHHGMGEFNHGKKHGHGHGHGHGPKEHREGRGHHGRGSSSSDSSDEVKFPWGQGCPYGLGKKEIKKWAKCMKKTAHAHKRSAEAYANQTEAEGGVSGSAPRTEGEGQQGNRQPVFDFTAAASQIQEVLNAFGVPIDVVELYDEWGNTSNRTNASNSQPQSTTGMAPPPSSTTTETGTTTGGTNQNLSAQLQQMHIGTPDTNTNSTTTTTAAAAAAAVAAPSAPTVSGTNAMEMEGDAGWTLLEPERIMDKTNRSVSVSNVTTTPETITLDGPILNETIIRQIPITIEPIISTTTTSNTSTTTTTDSVTGSIDPRPPIYPTLPTTHRPRPQFQQVMDGISNVIGNVTGLYGPPAGGIYPTPFTIPISTPPTSITSQQQQQQPPQELNDSMTMTLNQLLSMGFSNHDGWLSRLVASKNGNLDQVLNSLFPVGNNE